MNKNKHVKVDVVDKETAADLINSPRFSTLDELTDNCFEVFIFYPCEITLKIALPVVFIFEFNAWYFNFLKYLSSFSYTYNSYRFVSKCSLIYR